MSFCGVVVETAMNVTFPTLMAEFGVRTSTVQWKSSGAPEKAMGGILSCSI